MTDPRKNLANTLRQLRGDIEQMEVVAGFDGFVDELIEIVQERSSWEHYTPVPTISGFGDLIKEAAGRSSLREIVIKSVDAGGCAVNLGDAIARLGVQLDLFGTLGDPVHPAFKEISSLSRSCTSFGIDPGHTLALEFQDGKTMLSSMSQLTDLTPGRLEEILQDGKLAAACQSADLIAITNWTLYPHMTACWSYLQESIFSTLTNRPWIFVDLVDPRSRSEADIRAMLDVLPGFETGARCIFGGNLNEANVMADLLGLSRVEEEGPEVTGLCTRLRDALGITEVAVHCIRGAAVADADGEAWVDGPFTESPKKSTGAGDRYNAGYCLGRILNLDREQRCLLGNACSGYFVRNAQSGSLEEVAGLLEAWAEDSLA